METYPQYIVMLKKSVLQYVGNDSFFKVRMCRYSKLYMYIVTHRSSIKVLIIFEGWDFRRFVYF